MKYKCDKCDRPATHHAVEIIKGQKIEKHLCDEHAAEDGMGLKSVHAPINQLLTNFVKATSGTEKPVELKRLQDELGHGFSAGRPGRVLDHMTAC